MSFFLSSAIHLNGYGQIGSKRLETPMRWRSLSAGSLTSIVGQALTGDSN
jgi:hypothetical protein